MKTNKYIKIFIINTVLVAFMSKILPLFSKNISEHSWDRILLLYFLIFNSMLLFKIIKEEKNKGS